MCWWRLLKMSLKKHMLAWMFSLAMKMLATTLIPYQHPHLVSMYLHLVLGSAPHSGLLLMLVLGGSGDGRRNWVPANQVGGLDGFPGSQFWPKPSRALTIANIWEVN